MPISTEVIMNFFTKNLKGKIKYEIFKNLKDAIKKVFEITKKND